MPRQTGKTTQIIEQVGWCAMCDILPVCILVPNSQQAIPFVEYFLRNLDKEENSRLLVIPCGLVTHPGATDIHRTLDRIRRMNPVRIYIDEVDWFTKDFMDVIQRYYDDIIYAYGTLDLDGPDTLWKPTSDKRNIIHEMQCRN